MLWFLEFTVLAFCLFLVFMIVYIFSVMIFMAVFSHIFALVFMATIFFAALTGIYGLFSLFLQGVCGESLSLLAS